MYICQIIVARQKTPDRYKKVIWLIVKFCVSGFNAIIKPARDAYDAKIVTKLSI
jgi:hypothetical protein